MSVDDFARGRKKHAAGCPFHEAILGAVRGDDAGPLQEPGEGDADIDRPAHEVGLHEIDVAQLAAGQEVAEEALALLCKDTAVARFVGGAGDAGEQAAGVGVEDRIGACVGVGAQIWRQLQLGRHLQPGGVAVVGREYGGLVPEVDGTAQLPQDERVGADRVAADDVEEPHAGPCSEAGTRAVVCPSGRTKNKARQAPRRGEVLLAAIGPSGASPSRCESEQAQAEQGKGRGLRYRGHGDVVETDCGAARVPAFDQAEVEEGRCRRE